MQIDDKHFVPKNLYGLDRFRYEKGAEAKRECQWLTRSDATSRSLTILNFSKQAENRTELQSGGLQPMSSRLVAVKRRQEGCEDCEGACQLQTSRLRCRYASRILGALHRGMTRRSGNEEFLEVNNSRQRMRLAAPGQPSAISHHSGHKD